MDRAMTIEEFRAFMTSKSEQDESPLQVALRKLATIDAPEDVRILAEDPVYIWTPWWEAN